MADGPIEVVISAILGGQEATLPDPERAEFYGGLDLTPERVELDTLPAASPPSKSYFECISPHPRRIGSLVTLISPRGKVFTICTDSEEREDGRFASCLLEYGRTSD